MLWGDIYQKTLEVIWHHKNHEQRDGKLNLLRLNYPGEHQSEEYYYIWEVSLKSNNKY